MLLGAWRAVGYDGPMRTLLGRCALPAVMLVTSALFGCGDSDGGGLGGAGGGTPEPRGVCVRSSATYCNCFVVEGELLLSGGQAEVDSCAAADIGDTGLCWQSGEDDCACVSYECGADLEYGTCACFVDHNRVDPAAFPTTSCDTYEHCCLSGDNELCFCGIVACDASETEVVACDAARVAPLLDERDDTRTRVESCVPPVP